MQTRKKWGVKEERRVERNSVRLEYERGGEWRGVKQIGLKERRVRQKEGKSKKKGKRGDVGNKTKAPESS